MRCLAAFAAAAAAASAVARRPAASSHVDSRREAICSFSRLVCALRSAMVKPSSCVFRRACMQQLSDGNGQLSAHGQAAQRRSDPQPRCHKYGSIVLFKQTTWWLTSVMRTCCNCAVNRSHSAAAALRPRCSTARCARTSRRPSASASTTVSRSRSAATSPADADSAA